MVTTDSTNGMKVLQMKTFIYNVVKGTLLMQTFDE
jgi:hypothetical protein